MLEFICEYTLSTLFPASTKYQLKTCLGFIAGSLTLYDSLVAQCYSTLSQIGTFWVQVL